MKISDLFVALAVLIILFPTLLKSMSDGSLDLNGIILNLVATVQEAVTRSDAEWQSPEENMPPRVEDSQL